MVSTLKAATKSIFNMKKQLEQLLYDSGLIAEGCWDRMDSYDQEAIEKFGKLIVQECVRCVERTSRHHAITSYDWQLVESTVRKSVLEIKERFEL